MWAESSQGGERVEWRAFVLGSLEFLGFSGALRESVGRVLPRGRRMDQITKTPSVCWVGGFTVLGEGRWEI